MFSGWIRSTITTLFLVVVSSACALGVSADEDSDIQVQTPHQLVEAVTGELIESISVYRDTFDENPEEFFAVLDNLLKDVIDFDWIAYRVMGSYGKQATPEQRDRFARAFRCELIETYGSGLVAYGEQSIVVLPPAEDIKGARKVKVVQEIRGSDGIFPLVYSMGLNREGQWKVTNVIINGINLGKTFRNQFVQSAQKFGGDISQVTQNWSSSAGSCLREML